MKRSCHKKILLAHINIRSLRHKVHEVKHLLNKYDLAVLTVSETWLDDADGAGIADIDGYSLFRKDRSGKAGGGVCIYVKHALKAHVDKCNLELLWVRIPLRGRHRGLLVGCIYRPPSAGVDYWQLLEETMEGAEEEEIVLLGDLNVDFLKPASPSLRHLHQALLLPLNLSNLITGTVTRFYKGSCTSLDVVLSNSESLNSGLVADTDVSIH